MFRKRVGRHPPRSATGCRRRSRLRRQWRCGQGGRGGTRRWGQGPGGSVVCSYSIGDLTSGQRLIPASQKPSSDVKMIRLTPKGATREAGKRDDVFPVWKV